MTETSPPLAPHALPSHGGQCGAISLLVAISLVLLASLASFYSARSVLVDRLGGQNLGLETQALWAAEAALSWARAQMQRQFASANTQAVWGPESVNTPCPAGYSAPRWQCVALQPPPHPHLPEVVLQVMAVRDLISSPHVAQLMASAKLQDGTSRASVQGQVYIPTLAPAPSHPSTAAVVFRGCDEPGRPISSNVTGTSEAVCPGSKSPSPCTPLAWTRVLGQITPEQIRAWSEAQKHNGLSAFSQPARSVYWVDSPVTWTQSLGTEQAPVLLVFSDQACAHRCPSLAPGVRVVGTVVLQSQCTDDQTQAWNAGHIEGQLVVESGLPELRNDSRIEARELTLSPHRLPWPVGMDTLRVQRVPGSWQEGAP